MKVRIGETSGMVTVEKSGWAGGALRPNWTGAGGVADQIAGGNEYGFEDGGGKESCLPAPSG
ncbi:MAG: hypothetical protein V4675_09865 [Verrucomicrobiota bacterium]